MCFSCYEFFYMVKTGLIRPHQKAAKMFLDFQEEFLKHELTFSIVHQLHLLSSSPAHKHGPVLVIFPARNSLWRPSNVDRKSWWHHAVIAYFLLTSHSDLGQVALLDGSPVRRDSEIQAFHPVARPSWSPSPGTREGKCGYTC